MNFLPNYEVIWLSDAECFSLSVVSLFFGVSFAPCSIERIFDEYVDYGYFAFM